MSWPASSTVTALARVTTARSRRISSPAATALTATSPRPRSATAAMVTGRPHSLLCSGQSASWHDLLRIKLLVRSYDEVSNTPPAVGHHAALGTFAGPHIPAVGAQRRLRLHNTIFSNFLQ